MKNFCFPVPADIRQELAWDAVVLSLANRGFISLSTPTKKIHLTPSYCKNSIIYDVLKVAKQ